MTTKQATGIALKFFAISFLFSLLLIFPSLLTLGVRIDSMSGKQPSMLMQFLFPAIGIVVCLGGIALLWKVSNSLVKAGQEEEPVVNDMTVDEVMKIVLSCMGLYFAIRAILNALQIYASARGFAQHSTAGFQLDVNLLIVPGIQFALGCFLIARPKQWVKAIRSIGEK